MEDNMDFISKLEMYINEVYKTPTVLEQIQKEIEEDYDDSDKLLDILNNPENEHELRIAKLYYYALRTIVMNKFNNRNGLSVIKLPSENRAIQVMVEAIKTMRNGGKPEDFINDSLSLEEKVMRMYDSVMLEAYDESYIRYVCIEVGLNPDDAEREFCEIMVDYLNTSGDIQCLNPLNVKVEQMTDEKLDELEKYAEKYAELSKSSQKKMSFVDAFSTVCMNTLFNTLFSGDSIDNDSEIIDGDKLGGSVK